MGHAHHFLSRLDRLSRSHVELALVLYRDHERLHFLLDQANVPEGAERVAVSLEDPHEGPFVLVTRTGRFVTCLGRGMHVGDLPIITRAEFDALSAKHVVFQEREAARARLTGPDGGAEFLLSRLLESGPYLSREEFQALAALHPLIGDEYFKMSLEWGATSQRLQVKLKHAIVKRGTRLWPLQLEQLRLYWQTFFAASHLAVLALADGGEMFRQRTDGNEPLFLAMANALGAIAIDNSIVARTARSAWSLTHFGKAWIPHGRRQIHEAKTASDALAPAISLLAMGARHEDLREEIVEVFRSVPRLADPGAEVWSSYVCPAAVLLLENVEQVMADHLKLGAAVAFSFRDVYPPSSPFHYARQEDVPDDIAYSVPFQLINSYARDPEMRPHAISMIVAAARATPEQLYLPRSYVEFLEQKWEPEHSLTIMEGWLEQARQPAPKPAGPARKGPCPCGSGKKYKRCCAGEEAT
jgi:hypothetical protein